MKPAAEEAREFFGCIFTDSDLGDPPVAVGRVEHSDMCMSGSCVLGDWPCTELATILTAVAEEAGAGERVARDKVWCGSLIRQLNPAQIQSVVTDFNARRPDQGKAIPFSVLYCQGGEPHAEEPRCLMPRPCGICPGCIDIRASALRSLAPAAGEGGK